MSRTLPKLLFHNGSLWKDTSLYKRFAKKDIPCFLAAAARTKRIKLFSDLAVLEAFAIERTISRGTTKNVAWCILREIKMYTVRFLTHEKSQVEHTNKGEWTFNWTSKTIGSFRTWVNYLNDSKGRVGLLLLYLSHLNQCKSVYSKWK